MDRQVVNNYTFFVRGVLSVKPYHPDRDIHAAHEINRLALEKGVLNEDMDSVHPDIVRAFMLEFQAVHRK
jgi:hypothetical protein